MSHLYRYYLGSKFTIVVTDVDMMKEIFVKKFDNFVDRGSFAVSFFSFFSVCRTTCIIFLACLLQTFVLLMEEANGYPRGLFSSTGDIWKVSRHILSPAFSTQKLKQVLPLFVCALF